MTRRSFLKMLLALLGVISGGALWSQLRKVLPGGAQEAAAPAATTTPVPSSKPNPQASPEGSSPVPSAKLLMSFAILSDLHINADDAATSNALKQALRDVTSGDYKSDALMLTGDVTDYGRDADYKQLLSVLKSVQLPQTYANMGNHDYYDIWLNASGQFDEKAMPNGKTDAMATARFNKAFGYKKPYNDVWIGDCHFILLSMEAYVQEKPQYGEGAWYSDEQMAWFKAKMAEHKKGKLAFVMIHQPLPSAGRKGGNHTLVRADEFYDIVRPYQDVFVFCGHRHLDLENRSPHYVQETNTLHQFHNSSVLRVMEANYQIVDKQKSQGMHVEVYEDRVRVRGRDLTNGKWIKDADWTVQLKSKPAPI